MVITNVIKTESCTIKTLGQVELVLLVENENNQVVRYAEVIYPGDTQRMDELVKELNIKSAIEAVWTPDVILNWQSIVSE